MVLLARLDPLFLGEVLGSIRRPSRSGQALWTALTARGKAST